MVLNKTIGYIIAGFGILGIALSSESIKNVLGIPIPPGLGSNVLLVIGLILFAVGILILIRLTKSGKVKDVPIYQDKEVVGYRRIKAK